MLESKTCNTLRSMVPLVLPTWFSIQIAYFIYEKQHDLLDIDDSCDVVDDKSYQIIQIQKMF